LNGFKEVVTS